LLDNLSSNGEPPRALLSRYLPAQHAAWREGRISADPRALVRHKIREVTSVYSRACGGDRAEEALRPPSAPAGPKRAKAGC
jgi:D-tagatose-1,6-bisphosphate aldolase subunit GatZ/KbaZ